MSVFKELDSSKIKTSLSFLNQLVDVAQEDVSSSATRKKYQLYVTGGAVGSGVTSSLFQTVFDQDFTLQTANPVLDMTVGLFSGSNVVVNGGYTIDSNGKYIFPSQSLMMREKMDLYREFSQALNGNANTPFTLVSGSTSLQINEALFICFKRLFMRDQMKRETFAIRMYTSAAVAVNNLTVQANSASIYTDLSSSVNKQLSFGGQVSTIVDSTNVNKPVGLIYLDRGVAVLDISRVFDSGAGPWALTGTIRAVNAGGTETFRGNVNQLLYSASIDDIVDHIASTRFSGSTQTAMTFQNITNVNSTLIFCQLGADEFNYSSNPTYTDSNNRIICIEEGQEETQTSFTFITTVGLYDANDNLLAVCKTSRPILKDASRELTIKTRIDF